MSIISLGVTRRLKRKKPVQNALYIYDLKRTYAARGIASRKLGSGRPSLLSEQINDAVSTATRDRPIPKSGKNGHLTRQ